MTFVDANILLEIFFERSRLPLVQTALLSENNLHVSSSSVSHLLYFVEKEKADFSVAHELTENCIILSVNEVDITKAFEFYDGVDFEDALQVACALRHGCSKFMTIDKKLANKYAKVIKMKLIAT